MRRIGLALGLSLLTALAPSALMLFGRLPRAQVMVVCVGDSWATYALRTAVRDLVDLLAADLANISGDPAPQAALPHSIK